MAAAAMCTRAESARLLLTVIPYARHVTLQGQKDTPRADGVQRAGAAKQSHAAHGAQVRVRQCRHTIAGTLHP